MIYIESTSSRRDSYGHLKDVVPGYKCFPQEGISDTQVSNWLKNGHIKAFLAFH